MRLTLDVLERAGLRVRRSRRHADGPARQLPDAHGDATSTSTPAPAPDRSSSPSPRSAPRSTIGALQIGGEAAQLRLPRRRHASSPSPASASSSASARPTGDSFKWPSFLPIQIDAIGIQWADIQHRPDDFALTLSASVTGIKGIAGLSSPARSRASRSTRRCCSQGKFPIIGIDVVRRRGQGRHVRRQDRRRSSSAASCKLDQRLQHHRPLDTTTPVAAARLLPRPRRAASRSPGMAGFTIRVGLSRARPAAASFINVNAARTAILLDPHIGLTINDFVGRRRVLQDAAVDRRPDRAARPASSGLPTRRPPTQWLASLQQQVAAQAKTIQANPAMSGFAAAFTAPMTITGSAHVYSTLHLAGSSSTARSTVKISHRRQVPDHRQAQLRRQQHQHQRQALRRPVAGRPAGTVDGAVPRRHPRPGPAPDDLRQAADGLQERLRPGGQLRRRRPTVSPTAASTAPTGTVADPATNGGTVDVEVADGSTVDSTGVYITDPTSGATVSTGTAQAYIDVDFTAATGANLDYGYIYSSSAAKISLTGAINGATTITFGGNAIPLVTVNTETGVMNVPLMLENTSGADPDVFTYGPTRETVYNESQLACWSSNQCSGVDAQTLASELMAGAVAVAAASHLDVRIDTVTVNGVTMLGVTDLAKVVVLDKTASGLTGTALLTAAMDKMGVREFRYLLPAGDAFTTGTVTVTIAAGAVKNANHRRLRRRGHRRTEHHNDRHVRPRGTDRRADQPRQRRHDRHQRRQRPQLDRRHLRRAHLHHGAVHDDQSEFDHEPDAEVHPRGSRTGEPALDSTQAPVLIGNTPTTLTYRFWLTGEAANTSTAPVTLTFLANTWSYYLPSLPALPSVTVGVTSFRRRLRRPGHGPDHHPRRRRHRPHRSAADRPQCRPDVARAQGPGLHHHDHGVVGGHRSHPRHHARRRHHRRVQHPRPGDVAGHRAERHLVGSIRRGLPGRHRHRLLRQSGRGHPVRHQWRQHLHRGQLPEQPQLR